MDMKQAFLEGFMALLTASLVTSDAAAQPAWQPVQGPLMTRWTKEVSPQNVRPEYPRPQMKREEWLSLNGLWEFEPVAAGAKTLEPPVGQHLKERILVPFSIETTLSGVGRRESELWYRRTFAVPRSWKGRRILLNFGAVDWECQVWVNGKKVGEHKGGYDPFSFDITDVLKPSSGQQEVLLYVFDPTEQGHQPRGKQLSIPNGWFYTPTTGPWQTVWLEPAAPQRIEELVMRPDVERGRLELTVRTTSEALGSTLAIGAAMMITPLIRLSNSASSCCCHPRTPLAASSGNTPPPRLRASGWRTALMTRAGARAKAPSASCRRPSGRSERPTAIRHVTSIRAGPTGRSGCGAASDWKEHFLKCHGC